MKMYANLKKQVQQIILITLKNQNNILCIDVYFGCLE